MIFFNEFFFSLNLFIILILLILISWYVFIPYLFFAIKSRFFSLWTNLFIFLLLSKIFILFLFILFLIKLICDLTLIISLSILLTSFSSFLLFLDFFSILISLIFWISFNFLFSSFIISYSLFNLFNKFNIDCLYIGSLINLYFFSKSIYSFLYISNILFSFCSLVFFIVSIFLIFEILSVNNFSPRGNISNIELIISFNFVI